MIAILIITIIILSITILYLISPKMVEYIKEKKNLREKRRVQEIHNIIEEYLKTILKDE